MNFWRRIRKRAATAAFRAGVSSFDGTITADIPSARLTELFSCNNFVVSQVNPHVNFVLHLAEEGRGRRTRARARATAARAVIKLLRVANFLLLNIKYGVQKLLEVDLLNLRMVRTLQGILVQDFRGHVTVLPELRARDYARVLQHPSEEDMANFVRGGGARRGRTSRRSAPARRRRSRSPRRPSRCAGARARSTSACAC